VSQKDFLAGLEFPVYDGPTLDPIAKIHREHDGVLYVVKDGVFKKEESIKRRELDSVFPFLRKDLLEDSYYTVNAFYDQGKKTSRTIDNLRYLTLCFADLDCYQVGLKAWETIGKVGQMSEDGKLPPISALVKSGRGVWVFWMLKDKDDPDLPQRAFKDKREEWARIQAAIHGRLKHLGAEAKDGARYTRIPGSVNSKNGEQVSYLFLSGPEGPYVYTLQDLSEFFGLRAARREKVNALEAQGDKNAKKAAAGRLGAVAQVKRKLRDWENLCTMRNGFAESSPSRNKAILIGASLYFRNGLSISETQAKLEKWNKSFRPPLSEAEVQRTIFSAIKTNKKYRRPFSYATMRDDLGISEEEASRLEGNYYRPEVKPPTKQEVIAERRQVLRQVLGETKGKPSRRHVHKLLRERGIDVSLRTVHLDLCALENERGADGQKSINF